jgi:hypothetical protein
VTFSRLPTVESRRLLRSEHTDLLLLFRVDADGTNVLKVPLLIVVYRLLNPLSFAADQLAVFQGASDEHI